MGERLMKIYFTNSSSSNNNGNTSVMSQTLASPCCATAALVWPPSLAWHAPSTSSPASPLGSGSSIPGWLC